LSTSSAVATPGDRLPHPTTLSSSFSPIHSTCARYCPSRTNVSTC
jgi:hypothetical protein